MSAPTTFNPAAFPRDLCLLPQWVAWRIERREGKPTKVPLNARTGRMALTTAPSTWATIEEVIPFARANGYGAGFVFSATDPFVGVDLDSCIAGEEIEPWAWEIARALATYTEVSPSGTGLHCIARATLPPGGKRKGKIEMYDRARFFTITGDLAFDEWPLGVGERQAAIDELHARLFPPPATPPRGAATPTPLHKLDDPDVVRRAMGAANGQKFARLWLNQGHEYTSDSEADAALVAMLAFWTGPDAERLDALFRQSGRMRDKWERASYRDRTIALGLKRAEYYRPRATTATRQGLSFARRPA